MIKQLFFACILGCIGTIIYLQYDPWFQTHVARTVCNQIGQGLDCTVSYTGVQDLNIIQGSITLKHVLVQDKKHKDWFWSAKTFCIRFSWQELMLYGTLDLFMQLADVEITSKYENHLAILPHINTLLYGPQMAMPVIVKQVNIQRLHMRVYDQDDNTLHMLKGSMHLKKIHDALKMVMHVHDAQSTYQKRTCAHNGSGTIELHARSIESQPEITISGGCSIHIPYLGKNNMQCHIAGNWNQNQGTCTIKNNDQSFDITLRMYDTDVSITARAPLAGVWNMLNNSLEPNEIGGTCKLQARGNTHTHRAKGSLLLQEITLGSTPIGSLGRCTFEKDGEQWSGTLYGQRKSGISCSGSWSFDQSSGTGTMNLKNNTALFFSPSSQWCIPAHTACISCGFDQRAHLNGAFSCSAQQTKIRTTVQTNGTITADSNTCTITGSIGNNTYTAELVISPQIHMKNLTCIDHTLKKNIDLHADDHDIKCISGTVDFSCIRESINALFEYDLQGEGTIETNIDTHDTTIDLNLALRDGTIRLPQTYNFINGMRAHLSFNPAHKALAIEGLQCNLHKGVFESKRASLYFNDEGAIAFACTPLIFKDCLLNIQKDLFATVSGNLILQQSQYGTPKVTGVIILDQSQLNENIFSYTAQQSLMRNAKDIFTHPTTDMHLDVNLLSSNPIRVKTPFLETDAHVRLSVSNTLQNPNIAGSIQLQSGEITFPYKPLYISKGSLYFMPNQLYDPMIELEARNTIKKFNIAMQVTGSLKNHHISLNSSPVLSEEQIIALLLVGSQEESLNIVMPALIMQNIKQIIFGSEQTRNKISQYFTGFLKPFKYITLVPSFVDQTGRGGLRGAVEINVYDRLRALIQKNFSLTEDTRFEIEYMLSDDMSLRGVRDERRDLSGELEMRWKF